VWLCCYRFGEKSVLQIPLPLGTRSGTIRTGCASPSVALQTPIYAIQSGSVSRGKSQSQYRINQNRDGIVTCESRRRNRGIPVRTRVRRFSMCEKWTVGYYSGQTGILWWEVGADEYGSIVDPWRNRGSVRAERRKLHSASVTGKQRNEQVMSKQAGSRSVERDLGDLLFCRPAAMANTIVTRKSKNG
jgi:hypothetical protein